MELLDKGTQEVVVSGVVLMIFITKLDYALSYTLEILAGINNWTCLHEKMTSPVFLDAIDGYTTNPIARNV